MATKTNTGGTMKNEKRNPITGMTRTESKYLAGASTAKCDRSHGMTLEQMANVPRPTDDRAWVAGYEDRLASYRVDAARAQ